MFRSVISNNTLIPISAAIVVLSVGFSYGILYQKVNFLSTQVALLTQSVEQLSKDVNQLIGSQNKIISYEKSESK